MGRVGLCTALNFVKFGSGPLEKASNGSCLINSYLSTLISIASRTITTEHFTLVQFSFSLIEIPSSQLPWSLQPQKLFEIPLRKSQGLDAARRFQIKTDAVVKVSRKRPILRFHYPLPGTRMEVASSSHLWAIWFLQTIVQYRVQVACLLTETRARAFTFKLVVRCCLATSLLGSSGVCC